MLAVPDEDDVAAGRELLRPYFGMHRFEWPGEDSVEFHLGYGDWNQFVTTEWARQWPSEQAWKARKADR
jgi:hypothetical protein